MTQLDRRQASLDKLHDPETADNMDVRMELVRRMKAGDLTLAQVQEELARIKREGLLAGKPVWGPTHRIVQ